MNNIFITIVCTYLNAKHNNYSIEILLSIFIVTHYLPQIITRVAQLVWYVQIPSLVPRLHFISKKLMLGLPGTLVVLLYLYFYSLLCNVTLGVVFHVMFFRHFHA